MNIAIDCPSCGKKLRVLETLLGKHIQCPNCATKILVAPPKPEQDAALPAVTTQPTETPLPAPPRRRRREDDDEDDENPYRKRAEDDVASTVIPYKNSKALIAYYCGVFSLIPCAGLVLGPIALVLGILGFRYVRAHPEAKGTGHAIAGIILGSLTTLGNFAPILLVLVMIVVSALQSPSPSAYSPPRPISPPPPIVVAPKEQKAVAPNQLFEGPKTYLSDLQEFNVWPRGRSLGKNGDVGNATHDPIHVNGQASPKGLGLFAGQGGFGAMEYHLDGKYRGFQTTVAINDSFADNRTITTLQVYGDGKLLWKSKPIHTKGETDECRVDVTGVKVLRLRTQGGGAPPGCLHPLDGALSLFRQMKRLWPAAKKRFPQCSPHAEREEESSRGA